MNKDKLLAFLAAFFVFLSLICALLSNHYNGKVMGEASLGVGVWAPTPGSNEWLQKTRLRNTADLFFFLGIGFAVLSLIIEVIALVPTKNRKKSEPIKGTPPR